jgi:hypothetical protein
MAEGITPSFVLNVLRVLAGIAPYFLPPQIEVVRPGSYFGRLNSENGAFALLLKVRFRNESERVALIQSIRLRYAGACYEAIPSRPDRLFTLHGWVVDFPRREDNIFVAPRIPPMDVVERFALFTLPEPPERWPKNLEFTVKAKFIRRRVRKVAFMLIDRG